MKLRISIFIIALGVMASSCGKKIKSFSEYKKEEKEAINALIANENFEILDKYPANGVFGEKQFVLLENGCYLNVVDSGNGNRAIIGKTLILMRCSTVSMTPVDTNSYSTFPNEFLPMEFIYGNIDAAKGRAVQNSAEYMFLSPGIESALEYVGENAIVRMIIPFDNGQSLKYPTGIGSAHQNDAKIPMYFDRIRFAFDNY